MSMDMKCDICKTYYDIKGEPMSLEIVTSRPYSTDPYRETFDLCPECAKKLKYFINNTLKTRELKK